MSETSRTPYKKNNVKETCERRGKKKKKLLGLLLLLLLLLQVLARRAWLEVAGRPGGARAVRGRCRAVAGHDDDGV